MNLVHILLIFLGPWLVVGTIAVVAFAGEPGGLWDSLTRPAPKPPQRPVARPLPARLAVV